MYSNTHQFRRDDATKIGTGDSFRDYVKTTDSTKWVSSWTEFKAVEGHQIAFNEDQTEICLTLPVGHKFSIKFNREG